MRRRIDPAWAFVLFAVTAHAADPKPFPPTRDAICTPPAAGRSVVDRNKLADRLLERYAVSARAALKAKPWDTSAQLVARLLANDQVCKDGCNDGDDKNINAIRESVAAMLIGFWEPGYKPDRIVSAADFMSQPGVEIECATSAAVAEAPGAVFVAPMKFDKVIPNVRVRGKADQMYIDRSQKADFAASDKASISYSRDDVAQSNTFKSTLFVGYLIPAWQDKTMGQRGEIIPYLGVDRAVVRVAEGSSAKPSAKSTASFGALSSWYLLSRWGPMEYLGHVFNVRPDFTADHRTGARFASLNLEYIPVRTSWLNDFRRMGADSAASFKWILSAKANAGHFADRGTVEPEKRADYSRLGGKIGFALVSDNPAVPLEFVATYVSMAALKGRINVDYRTASLSYSFDSDKYFGISLSYKNGKREDTAIKDDEVTFGFTARF